MCRPDQLCTLQRAILWQPKTLCAFWCIKEGQNFLCHKREHKPEGKLDRITQRRDEWPENWRCSCHVFLPTRTRCRRINLEIYLLKLTCASLHSILQIKQNGISLNKKERIKIASWCLLMKITLSYVPRTKIFAKTLAHWSQEKFWMILWYSQQEFDANSKSLFCHELGPGNQPCVAAQNKV